MPRLLYEHNQELIYLDNNSTTRVDPEVLREMLPFLSEFYGNESSSHHFGVSIRGAVENAREQVANMINSEPNEIYFTSGATEGLNLALLGLVMASPTKRHVITCSTEHSAVLDTCRYLQTIGVDVTYLSVDCNGMIDRNDILSSIRSDTLAICLMWVNNETGVINDLIDIAQIARENGIYFLSDATQGIGKLPMDVSTLDVDILVLSAHKFYGPKGVGAVYINNNLRRHNNILAIMHGGGHESGMRSGTLNVPGIVGLGKACSLASLEMCKNYEKISELNSTLTSRLQSLPGTIIHGFGANRIKSTVNFSIPDLDANVFIARHKNLAISNGSACTSRILQPSYVLTAMGVSSSIALSSLRISIGKWNLETDIDRFLTMLEIR